VGSIARPLTPEALLEKVATCCSATLSQSATAALLDMLVRFGSPGIMGSHLTRMIAVGE
jgi:hypothetical protein